MLQRRLGWSGAGRSARIALVRGPMSEGATPSPGLSTCASATPCLRPDELFYKIVLVIGFDNEIEATAFIFNQENRGDIQQRIVPIDEVERRTGLDCLAGMEDGADALEAVVGAWPWP